MCCFGFYSFFFLGLLKVRENVKWDMVGDNDVLLIRVVVVVGLEVDRGVGVLVVSL